MRVYVVTEPEEIRGIYESWEECRAKVAGVAGARYQAVAGRHIAEAMLEGPGISLDPGRYAFTDGNADGGVGVVLVSVASDGTTEVEEIAKSVREIFDRSGIAGLESPEAIARATTQRRNEFTEMAGLYLALSRSKEGNHLTVVHDYKGVAEYIENRWQARGSVTPAIVEACRILIRERKLQVSFRYQPGHQSGWAGRDDFAYWNGRADRLAREGGRRG
jgi:hypothetical protein